MPPARLSPAEIIADVPSCAKLSRAVSVTTSRLEASFLVCKSVTGACANRNDKHSDNDDIYV